MKFYNHTFKSMTASGIEKRNGYKFDYMLADGTMVQLGVYKTDGKKPVWNVIDLACGLSICSGATRGEAVDKAESLRAKYTEVMGTPKYRADVAKFEAAANPRRDSAGIRTETARIGAAPEQVRKPAEQQAAGKEKAKADAATVISLETMSKWCEGKGLKAKQVHPGSGDNVWVLGPSKPYKPELLEMGFRWGTSKHFGKGWYREPTTA